MSLEIDIIETDGSRRPFLRSPVFPPEPVKYHLLRIQHSQYDDSGSDIQHIEFDTLDQMVAYMVEKDIYLSYEQTLAFHGTKITRDLVEVLAKPMRDAKEQHRAQAETARREQLEREQYERLRRKFEPVDGE
jgi:hypothetical protein